MPSRSYSNEKSESDAKSFQLMTDMHNEIQRKEGIIEQLKQLIEVLKQRERERDAPIGLVIIHSLRWICCSTDYERPVRKSPSLHGQKSTPNPNF